LRRAELEVTLENLLKNKCLDRDSLVPSMVAYLHPNSSNLVACQNPRRLLRSELNFFVFFKYFVNFFFFILQREDQFVNFLDLLLVAVVHSVRVHYFNHQLDEDVHLPEVRDYQVQVLVPGCQLY